MRSFLSRNGTNLIFVDLEQLTQNLKSGHMEIMEVPFPVLNSGCVLVRNYFSLISAGTEGKTVKDARLGYIGKAMARKEEVKKVVKSVKAIGLLDTYRLAMNKLDAPSALGYSCAGEVIAVASDVAEFRVGDMVACAGAGAVHAEVVAVPKNLCVPVPENISMQHAAFTTLGAIAMQGFRQSELKLGESCAVIGLGLIGQLTIQLLKAAGVKAIGIDIDKNIVDYSKKAGLENIFQRNDETLVATVKELSSGYGVDSVIITASSASTDPVDLAGELCRPKGKVVIVGNVPTGFERKSYYRKELDLRMSCSYGPGRYDAAYEEQGSDYPYAYVRWTENRNMQAFLGLLADKKISLESVTTHTFDFPEATKAYQMILDKEETYLGILLKYDLKKELKSKVEMPSRNAAPAKVNAALIGAGSFASNVLLPALENKCSFTGIVTSKPNNAKNIASKYAFRFCSASANDIFSDAATNVVFISTRHNSHAEYVLASLMNKKHVFVEKPLCLTEEELNSITQAYKSSGALLMVGFNRRFAPLIQKAKNIFNGQTPVSINYRINAGMLPKDHWTQDPNVGGGRILGELCHFIDLCAFIAASPVESVSAVAVRMAQDLNDTVSVNLMFENGSIASVSYFSNGGKELEKEYLEIFGAGQTVIIHDFKSMDIYGKSHKAENLNKQDKGHKAEMTAFVNAIEKGKISPVSFEEIYNSTLATIRVQESVMQQGRQLPVK
jgi:polar amino acid transport system substrate-binding protein